MAKHRTIQDVRARFPDWRLEFQYGYWYAWHDGYEASWEGEEDGWVGNGLDTCGRTPADVEAEIECIIEEHPFFQNNNKSETGNSNNEPHS